MLANQIEVGKTYEIRHHDGQLYTVKVEYLKTYGIVRTLTHYMCTKLATGRTIEVKSAAKFRREVL